MISKGQSHRFRDSVALYVGKGETVYMQPAEARNLAAALIETADSVEREPFAKSSGLTRQHVFTNEAGIAPQRDAEGRATPGVYTAAAYSARWPSAPDGRFRVALYRAAFETSPVVYFPYTFADFRTLKAAARHLAHLIHAGSKRGYSGERYASLYVVTPEGERLPLRAAQARIKESSHVA